MNPLKKIVKLTIPKKFQKDYKDFQFMKSRMYFAEQNMNNKWLFENGKKPKTQKEIFKSKEFRLYSQNGEDGIINYIFSKIGITNKTLVEFGIEDGSECNSANLIMNFGWNGLLIEGNKDYSSKAKEFYKDKPVKIINDFITRENINDLFKKGEVVGEIDLLSIDIDGNDYWVWDKIDSINPRVIIIEYNSTFGLKPITVKYNPSFERFSQHSSGLYFGASLTAITKLAKKKGYILVCSCSGTNAFYIRKDVAKKIFGEISVENAFEEDRGKKKKFGDYEKRFEIIKNLKFENI